MQNLEADIIIIAAGAAGLSAAVAAAQKGLSVIVFEKNAVTGGTANKGMGPLGIESRHTRSKLLKPSKDEAFKVFMDYTHWRVDAKLVRAFLNKSGETIHWLESLGVEFVEPATYFADSYSTWHLVKPEFGPPGPGGAATMMKILTQKAIDLGVRFYLECAVNEIIKKDDVVIGVRAKNKEGNTLTAQANAVIIATGGFGNNPSMIKEHTDFTVDDDIYPFKIPGVTGDGIQMAWSVGAQKTEMCMELVYDMPDPLNVPPQLHEACRQPHLFVNYLGERFMNEAIMANVTFTGNALALQKNKTGFLIFDEHILHEMEQDFDTRNRVFPKTNFENSSQIIDDYLKSGKGNFYVADTLEDLAEQTGIDTERLRETVNTYNSYCQNGYDEQFNKERKYLRPLKGGKWYAGRHFPSAYGSAGGIKINEKTQVIGQDWKPIKGLYAAGTDACSIYGDSYPFIFPGTSMGFAINTGRIAIESISETF
ncbi:MAG: FAD-dependent oxidoreductase [Gammaproteobacteria bacterium]|nr:FAD-dependent oxidoreductase [Gammaproteobacteria bacterium]MBU1467415.1 FAD-dependent oxidoreductase [Gammaproteobacteria bacterium]MBU2024076.1 FAD-dependent oxidoreductase [Gammaproteobacteria bacterium]MBU2238364.1 FAD-dependent oxidoreductase [Gammaproteobacteria bacterium]MBU2319118.1 FAD-dependent oxidoreductase [Gammaproteobacteria bacterium]